MSNQKDEQKISHSDVLTRIRDEQQNFSAAQRQVADYVLKYFHQIPFLSISALAGKIGVSNNSIIKFCNHLGFPKFAEFKRVFSEHAHATLTAPPSSESNTDANGGDFFLQNLEDDIQSVTNTMNNPANRENLPKAASMITKARRIFVCGGSRSYPMAYTLTRNLQWMRLPATTIYYEPDTFWTELRTATPEDLVIMFCLPGYANIAIDGMKRLQKQGVPILLLTDDGLSPALPHADLALYCAVYDHFYVHSGIGVYSMISTLMRRVNHQLDIEKYHKNHGAK